MTLLAAVPDYLSEPEVYGLLQKVGLNPPRHGMLGEDLPFEGGDPVVLKGQGRGLLHKTEAGAVRFMAYDPATLEAASRDMQQRIEAEGHPFLGALVCERLAFPRVEGLPTEGFVSLTLGEGGWTLLMGFGGLQAEALAAPVPPLCWPMAFVTPEAAWADLSEHLLGRIWRGTLRGTRALATDAVLKAFLDQLWALRSLAEDEDLDLVELNPVVLDAGGLPRPLDGVARRREGHQARLGPPADFLDALLEPRSIALAGVSSVEGGVGRTILGNLRRCGAAAENLVLLKPDHETFLGLPCLPDVGSLAANPVDLLILALPAPATADAVSRLLAQGGGARVVALVAGGIGDGADVEGLGLRLRSELQAAREAGRWTPALMGPNFLGHWVPAWDLDTSFIPIEKLAAPASEGGPLALLSQSGAFLLCRRSQNPSLPLGLAVALGNQMDVGLPDMLEALEARPECQALGLYVEGFGPSHLEAVAAAGRRLRDQGRALLLYRGGRTEAGQAAAASHTGAMAGDRVLEEALLRRAGFGLAPTQRAFDAGLAWLGAYPGLRPGPVAVATNAGFESVTAADLLEASCPSGSLDEAAVARLVEVLEAEGLGGLVAPRLPLDLTPMASEAGYLRAVEVLLDTPAQVVVLGLVPFTRRLHTEFQEAAPFARALADLARVRGKALGVVVDAGGAYESYRDAMAVAGLPVFSRMEDALEGLKALG